MADWDTGCFDDPAPGVTGDVFGRDVGDVDVWRANDSFGGDEEWLAFNVGDDDLPTENAPILKGKKPKQSSTKDDKEKRRSKIKSSSRETSERSKQSSSSSSPSKSKREKTTQPASLRGFLLDTKDHDEDGVPGHESSSVSTRSTSEEIQGRTRHTIMIPMSPRASPRAVVDPAKPRSARRRPSDSNHLPRGSNHLPIAGSCSNHGSRSSRDLLKNGSNHRSRAQSPSTRDWNLEVAPPMTPNRRERRAVSDDALASSYRTSGRRVSSSPRAELVRQKDGSVIPRRPRDRARRLAQSNNRRESVKGSLFKLLEEDLPPAPDTQSARRGHGPNLQGFIRQDSFSSVESTGVQSAPPSVGLSPLPPSSRDVKSRRWNKKMLLPPSQSPKKQVTAAGARQILAQEGYIEVVDGKMRLVVDLPTL
jgi:hypothetical protein